jgi:hypothetical protein
LELDDEDDDESAICSSDTTRPRMPAIMRISPTTSSSMPETLKVTAYRRIAPIAIKRIEVPIFICARA